MPGATLSRWTMSYFASALVALIAAEILMAAGFGYPAVAQAAPQTLVLVHLVAIGWLSLLMCGALFQFVPVLVARPIHSNALPLPTLGCLVAGLAALLTGFLQLDGFIASGLPMFSLAAALLGLGFSLALWNLGRTLWAARPLPLPARFVVVGLFSIAATAALGIVFTLVLDGSATDEFLLDLKLSGVPVHAVAGLGGWLTFTAMGVSYRLLSMFMLAPEHDGASTRGAFYCGTAALGVAILGSVAVIYAGGGPEAMLGAAMLLGLCALGLYGRDIARLYRTRKRRVIELNSRMALVALANLLAAAAATAVLAGLDAFDRFAAPVVFLFVFGWLSGLGLAKLYKIVAFLTWLECYGPVLGKTVTPRVQDLVVERRAVKWFVLYYFAVWGATVALFFAQPQMFRLGAAAMAIATGGIVVHLVRTRRLSDVKAALRLPAGVRTPLLLRSRTQPA